MSNGKSTAAKVLFLLAAAGGFEEFGRHMVHEDRIQVQVRDSQPYSTERDNLISDRETERRLALLGVVAGFGSLIGLGAVSGRKNSPEIRPS